MARTPLGVDWVETEQRSTVVECGPDGAFTQPVPAGDEDSASAAFWISHPEFETTVVVHEGPEPVQVWPAPAEAAPTRVVVVDETGSAAEGATIAVFHARDGIDAVAEDLPLAAALRLYRRDLTADAAGGAQFNWSRHPAVARAQLGDAVSAWTAIELGDQTRIQLGPSFGLRVRVESSSGVRPGPDALLRAWTEEGERVFLASQPITGLGLQPALTLPRVDARRLIVTADGAGFLGSRQSLPLPEVHETLDVVFELVAGSELVLLLQDESQAPIAGADISLSWGEGLSAGGSETSYAQTDSSGRARLTTPLDGRAIATVFAQGFQDARVDLLLPRDEPLTITLSRGVTVRGRVVHGGQPIDSTFRVSYWEQGSAAIQGEWYTSGDGSFEITDSPTGEVAFSARSVESPPSTVRVVSIPIEGLDGLELELPSAVPARGRVVDALTGEAVDGASVYQCSATSAKLVEIIGTVDTTDSEGRFEIPNSNPVVAGFGIAAEGYGEHWDVRANPERREGSGGSEVDLGVIALFPRRDMTVRLVHDGSVDPTAYRTWTTYGDETNPIAFDPDGVAVIEDTRYGWQHIRLLTPEGRLFEQHVLLSDLAADEPWEATFRLTGQRFHMTVHPEGLVPPERIALYGMYRAGPAHRLAVHATLEVLDGRVEAVLEHVPAQGELAVDVLDTANSALIASTAFDLAAQRAGELHLGGPSLEVELVDAQGEPIPGADVCAMTADADFAWQPLVKTDAQGVAHLPIAGLERVLVHVFDRTVGHKHGIPLDLTTGERRLRVQLDDLSALELDVRDGELPLEGVRAVLFHPSHSVSVTVGTSDASGRMRLDQLSADTYRLSIRHPNHWPVERTIEHGPENAPQVVQVRRLADLDLQLLTAGGAPLANHDVELTSTEFDTDVATWLDAGLVEGQLYTDATGHLELWDLPRGPYTLRVTQPGQPPHTELLDLEPGENDRLLGLAQ